jgi:hypothetical protein
VRSTVTCPGCGAALPGLEQPPEPEGNASGECTAAFHEVIGFEFQHPVMLRFHQMSVDAYGAQHGGGTAKPIRLAYSLAGLWLALEHGFSGDEVRAIHQRMGHPTPEWPDFDPVPAAGWTTVADVLHAGVRRRSETGHAKATRDWAADVWCAWLRERPGTPARVEALLRRIFVLPGGPGLLGTVGSAGAVHRLLGVLEGPSAARGEG